jgi:geranylgeranyl pyrophosphate synthase
VARILERCSLKNASQLSDPSEIACAFESVTTSGLADAFAHALRQGHLPLDGQVPTEIWQATLLGPISDFIARPGKAFRARLCGLAYGGSNGTNSTVVPQLGAIVEAIHAGSLIVDDVQDGSLQRRGAPALHQTVGVPLAINTGSWLYFWALSQIFSLPMATGAHAQISQRATQTMMRCHQGQALDLGVRVTDVAPHIIESVTMATTRSKTGALFGFAGFLGAITAGAKTEACDAWSRFGENLGVGLQMLDDLGSVTSPSRRHKGIEDISQGRATWPWTWLVELADVATVQRLLQRANNCDPSACASVIEEVASIIGAHGRRRAHAHLQQAMMEIAAFATLEAMAALHDEIVLLEASYG